MKRFPALLLILVVVMVIAALVPPLASAQIPEAWDAGGTEYCVISGVATIQGLQCMLKNIFSVAITFIGLAAFVMLIIGSFGYLLSGGNSKGTEQARNTITFAVVGIVVALSAFIVLNFISIFTGIEAIRNFVIPESGDGSTVLTPRIPNGERTNDGPPRGNPGNPFATIDECLNSSENIDPVHCLELFEGENGPAAITTFDECIDAGVPAKDCLDRFPTIIDTYDECANSGIDETTCYSRFYADISYPNCLDAGVDQDTCHSRFYDEALYSDCLIGLVDPDVCYNDFSNVYEDRYACFDAGDDPDFCDSAYPE